MDIEKEMAWLVVRQYRRRALVVIERKNDEQRDDLHASNASREKSGQGRDQEAGI
jgi:hypothetical protein